METESASSRRRLQCSQACPPPSGEVTVRVPATDFSDATLLIIGHGSTVNGDSGATVFQHAAELRRRGIFAEVREAFFKIEPRIGATLASIRTPRIFVVPFFTAEGYFTQQAIPAELGLPADLRPLTSDLSATPPSPRAAYDLAGRKLFYCAPVGTHPLMTQIILTRANEAVDNTVPPHPVPLPIRWGEGARRVGEGMPETPDPRLQTQSTTALVIAGHGTELNPDSRKSIERQVELIAAKNLFAEVHPAFLEESPRIADIPKFVKAPRIVVVPFFMSDGLHVCEDIPVLLGESAEVVQARLKAGEWPWRNPTERNGKTIFYTRGVGSEPGIADVILERACDMAVTT